MPVLLFMRLVASPPVTIHAVRHGFRWFPTMFRHTDGTLFLYIEYTYDAHFAPVMRLRSTDGGHTWIEEDENVPRLAFAHSFPDGELFEMDFYGFLDPREKDVVRLYGALSFPSDSTRPVRKEFIKLSSSSLHAISYQELLIRGFPHEPTHPWWQLLNVFELGEEKALQVEERLGYPPVPKAFDTGENIKLCGPFFTSGIECEGRLIALGYGVLRLQANGQPWPADGSAFYSSEWSVFCFESRDRGRTWEEVSLVARGMSTPPDGFTEATLVRLKDGRLYSIIRTGNVLHHTWSSDGGKTWLQPTPMKCADSDHQPRSVWPVCKVLDDGALVLVYGRPGKHIIFDPSGTGAQWQGHVDLHALELATQEQNGVPPKLRLRGIVGSDQCIRQWDSGDYLFLVPVGPREMLVGYDVQIYIEHPNSPPVSGVRMTRVRLED